MRDAARIGRLVMLAAGLGIGAALAGTPGVASADSSPFGLTPTELADVDQVLRLLFDPSGADIQVSVDGMDLFPTAGNTATANSGTGLDIAIAVGTGANANSAGPAFPFGIPLGGGIGDVAFANGPGSTADAGLIGGANFDFVYASGPGSFANAELGATSDIASAIGTDSHAVVGVGDTLDTAFANGPESFANVGLGEYDLAYADANSSANSGVGSSDTAIGIGGGNANAEGFFSNALADGGNTTADANGGFLNYAFAGGGNAEASAVLGNSNLAWVFNTGSAFDQAIAGGTGNLFSNNDLATIIGTGDTAFAGADPTTAGNLDFAIVLGDMMNVISTGGNFLLGLL
jgi:hypothetical protein